MGSITDYFNSVSVEFKNLTWPTKKDAGRLTAYVIGGSLLVGFVTGGLDLLLSSLLKLVLSVSGK
jgi:preprotein translocase subunit SecE